MVVPFLGCMLSVAMLLRLKIEVPEIDKTFMESLPRIQDAYKRMYPYANFKLEVTAHKVVRCPNYYSPPQYTRTSLFFTGGVDATSALIEKIEDKPLLINIWGGM